MQDETQERKAIRKAIENRGNEDTDRNIIERAAQYLSDARKRGYSARDLARLDRIAREDMGLPTSDYESDQRWREQIHARA